MEELLLLDPELQHCTKYLTDTASYTILSSITEVIAQTKQSLAEYMNSPEMVKKYGHLPDTLPVKLQYAREYVSYVGAAFTVCYQNHPGLWPLGEQKENLGTHLATVAQTHYVLTTCMDLLQEYLEHTIGHSYRNNTLVDDLLISRITNGIDMFAQVIDAPPNVALVLNRLIVAGYDLQNQ